MMTGVVDSRDDVPMVGRAREFAHLKDAVTRAAASTPSAVLLTGEAGAGKSRLISELYADLPQGALVLRAQCVDLGDPGLPYLALADLIRALQAEPELSTVIEGYPVVATLTAPQSGNEPVDESRRLQVLAGLAALLADAGRLRTPAVVVVEDLQWIDESSAAFLRFLVSRMHAEPVVLIATVRTDGVTARPRVRALLSELSRLAWVNRLDLLPFDAGEVAAYLELAGLPADSDAAAGALRRTGGNPYYLQTLVAAGQQGSDEQGLPRALADNVVGRLDGLTDDARTLVRAASVATREVSDAVLRQVLGLPDAAMDAAARLAVAEGILQPKGSGYAFGHDLMRSAVYDDLLPGERTRLHAAHALALEAGVGGAASAAEIAHHYAAADDAPKSLTWTVRAAEQALRAVAPAEALIHLERALSLWPSVADAATLAGATQGRLATMAAMAGGLAGEPAKAIEWARLAIRLCDADGDAAGSVEARAELVRRMAETDAVDQVVEIAEEAVRLAEGLDARSVALAHVVLARALLAARRTDEASPQADSAVQAAKAAGAAGLEVEALTTAAFADEVAGDRPAAAARLGSAMRLARAEGEWVAELRAHYMLASLHYYNGDVAGALPVLEAAIGRVNESGLLWSGPGVELRILQAVARYVSGDFDGSLRAANAPESRPPDVAGARLAAISCYAAVAGGHADAEARIDSLRDSWDLEPQVAIVAGGCEADLLTWRGDFAGAVAAAERAQLHLDRVAGEGMYAGLWLSALGLAALADQAERARHQRDDDAVNAAVAQGDLLLARVERIVASGRGRAGDLGPEGRAWHRRAIAEHARLTDVPTVEAWQQALDAFGYGHVYEQARCHWRLAEALIASGDRPGAREKALAAAAMAETMQALPLRQAIAAFATRTRLLPSAQGADAVLTEREREVLALVAEGLTNKEIGKRLFISDKTASVHLSNVMTKLNVTSRTEAVTVAHRRGLLDVIGPDRS